MKTRWPGGFRCPCYDGSAHCVVRAGGRKLFQRNVCHHQTSLIADTVFLGAKLRPTVWFLAIYVISQAKTGLSALDPDLPVEPFQSGQSP